MRAPCLLLAIAAAACSGNTPISVGDRFVGRYYVELDQEGALALATGSAADRLRRELALVTEARRGAGVAERPRVYFDRVGEPLTKGNVFRITYKLTIQIPVRPS